MAAADVAALALMGGVAWSAPEEPDELAGAAIAGEQPHACANAPAEPLVPVVAADDALAAGVQVVTVEVPAVAIVEVVAGAPASVRTNAGRPPAPGDEVYQRVGSGFEPADAELIAAVVATRWVPAPGADPCWPEAWLPAA